MGFVGVVTLEPVFLVQRDNKSSETTEGDLAHCNLIPHWNLGLFSLTTTSLFTQVSQLWWWARVRGSQRMHA